MAATQSAIGAVPVWGPRLRCYWHRRRCPWLRPNRRSGLSRSGDRSYIAIGTVGAARGCDPTDDRGCRGHGPLLHCYWHRRRCPWLRPNRRSGLSRSGDRSYIAIGTVGAARGCDPTDDRGCRGHGPLLHCYWHRRRCPWLRPNRRSGLSRSGDRSYIAIGAVGAAHGCDPTDDRGCPGLGTAPTLLLAP